MAIKEQINAHILSSRNAYAASKCSRETRQALALVFYKLQNEEGCIRILCAQQSRQVKWRLNRS